MSQHQDDRPSDATDDGRSEQQQEIADVQEELDAESEGDGLAAESGRGEETGLSQG